MSEFDQLNEGIAKRAAEVLSFQTEENDLARTAWGDKSLEGEEHVFESIFESARSASYIDASLGSSRMAHELHQHLGKAQTAIKKVLETSSEQIHSGGKPGHKRSQLLNELKQADHNLKSALVPLMSLELRGKQEVTLERAREEQEEISRLLDEVKGYRDAAQQAIGELGAGKHAENFRNLARRYSIEAVIWLVSTIVLLAGWVALAIYFYGEASDGEGLTKVALRITLLAAGLGAATWAARNYKANRHNIVVNRHRATALDTFRTFVKSADDDDETKKAILLQTTHTIFVSQPSGYTNEKEPPASPATTVVEILRSVGKGLGKP